MSYYRFQKWRKYNGGGTDTGTFLIGDLNTTIEYPTYNDCIDFQEIEIDLSDMSDYTVAGSAGAGTNTSVSDTCSKGIYVYNTNIHLRLKQATNYLDAYAINCMTGENMNHFSGMLARGLLTSSYNMAWYEGNLTDDFYTNYALGYFDADSEWGRIFVHHTNYLDPSYPGYNYSKQFDFTNLYNSFTYDPGFVTNMAWFVNDTKIQAVTNDKYIYDINLDYSTGQCTWTTHLIPVSYLHKIVFNLKTHTAHITSKVNNRYEYYKYDLDTHIVTDTGYRFINYSGSTTSSGQFRIIQTDRDNIVPIEQWIINLDDKRYSKYASDLAQNYYGSSWTNNYNTLSPYEGLYVNQRIRKNKAPLFDI